eukprot:gene7053-4996_t
MGLFGLRRFIDAAGVTHLLPVPVAEEYEQDSQAPVCSSRTEPLDTKVEASTTAPAADHVLVDLNCIVHACFGQQRHSDKVLEGGEERHFAVHTKKMIIQAVLHRLEVLLTRVVRPRASLTLCLDGPAPLAKLQTQRLRRRKVSLMDSTAAASRGDGGEINALAVTAGSLFMVELENAIAAAFKQRGGKGFLHDLCPVFLHGTTVMGEGESKISRALMYVAYGDPSVDTLNNSPCRGRGNGAGSVYLNDGPPPYHPDDTVVVLGNDIDLVMTCLGATYYHNIFVVSPASLQCISVSDLLYRWMRASAAAGSNRLQLGDLPTLRVDFMFLFLLNGGDHYAGAGDVALGLWQRYKTVRAAQSYGAGSRRRPFSLVHPSLDSLNVNALADILQAEDYTGDADAEVGLRLLRSALWSLYTTVTGICPDYRYLPPQEDQPNLSHLRAAAALCKRKKKAVSFPFLPHSTPLTPLEHFVALMPTLAAMPSGVSSTLQKQPGLKQVSAALLSSNNPQEVATAAEKAVAAAGEKALRPSERFLCHFTAPVQLNVLPPRRRLSRHEQHRLISIANKKAAAEGGRAAPLQQLLDPPPEPVVRVVTLPAEIDHHTRVVGLTYPAPLEGLQFCSPFEEQTACASPAGSAAPSTAQREPEGGGRDETHRRRFIPFESNANGGEEGGVAAQLEHNLAVAHRLEAKGFHRAAQGKKMRRKLWKAQATMTDTLRREAAQDDWRYAFDAAEEEGDREAKENNSAKRRRFTGQGRGGAAGAGPDGQPVHGKTEAEDFGATISSFLGDTAAAEQLLRGAPPHARARDRTPKQRGKKEGHKRRRETVEEENRIHLIRVMQQFAHRVGRTGIKYCCVRAIPFLAVRLSVIDTPTTRINDDNSTRKYELRLKENNSNNKQTPKSNNINNNTVTETNQAQRVNSDEVASVRRIMNDCAYDELSLTVVLCSSFLFAPCFYFLPRTIFHLACWTVHLENERRLVLLMSSKKKGDGRRFAASSSSDTSDSTSDSTDLSDDSVVNELNINAYCSGGTQGGFHTTFATGHRHTRVGLNPTTNRTRVLNSPQSPMNSSPTSSSSAAAAGGGNPVGSHSGGGGTLRYRTDLNKAVIHFMMERLVSSGAVSKVEEIVLPARDDERDRDTHHGVGDWHFFWMTVGRIRTIFQGMNLDFRLQDTHIINHFPNHYELTRKDLMYKNIKAYNKECFNSTSSSDGGKRLTLQIAMNWEAAAFFAGTATSSERERKRVEPFHFADSVPITYNIPNDMNLFIEEFKKHVGVTWIVKPTSRCQGKGIFLVNRLQQITRWAKEKREVEQQYAFSGVSVAAASNNTNAQNLLGSFIVSKYISNPLLIGGKKFDLRLYVLVTSFKPLVAYLHECGFARFCATKYTGKCTTEEDLGSHLTNVALQKGEDEYNTSHGGKWLVKQLILYVEARYGPYTAEGLLAKIKFLVTHSLMAMKDALHNDKHCFELYGYDILIDADINPHLIEVNASPSLSTTTTTDRILKEEVLADTMNIVLPPGFASSKGGTSYYDHRLRSDLGMELGPGFTLL